MLVTLEALKPNPTRDFHVDPMIDQTIDNLEQSIKQDGFWGGVVCRRNPAGEIEIAAGHHRVAGAIRAGVKTADLFVSTEMDEVGLIRIYASENATQRGNSGTAQLGTVASALRYLAKALMTKATREIPSSVDVDVARQRLSDSRGIGEPIITKFLASIPGLNENTVRRELATLKSSGDYARIISEVVAEIERENAVAILKMREAEHIAAIAAQAAAEAEEARKVAVANAKAASDAAEKDKADREQAEAEAAAAEALRMAQQTQATAAEFDPLRKTIETAQKADEKASQTEITFDLEGVAKVFDHAGLLETFRKEVTSEGIKPYLQVKEQAKLARHLLKLAKERNVNPMTSRFISENIGSLVHLVKTKATRLKRDDKAKLLRSNWNKQAAEYQHQFSRQATGMLSHAKKLAAHSKKRPEGVTLHASKELTSAIKAAKEALKIIGVIV